MKDYKVECDQLHSIITEFDTYFMQYCDGQLSHYELTQAIKDAVERARDLL